MIPWTGGCTPVTNVAWFGYVLAGRTAGTVRGSVPESEHHAP